MKRTVLFVLLTAFYLSAAFVPLEKAKKVAENYYGHYCAEAASKGSTIVSVQENKFDDLITRYTFEFDKGFVIVTADDGLYPILGYSDHGKVTSKDADGGQNFKEWFENYDQQILCAKSKKYIDEDAAILWKDIENNIFPAGKAGIIVDRLVKVSWDQIYPWNASCPLKSYGNWTYVGCTATAMAQILRYHRWPDVGNGSASYSWNNGATNITLSADFTSHTWNYDLMPEIVTMEYGIYPAYWETGITQAEKDELALQSYWMGLSINMSYGDIIDGGSGAYMADIDNAFVDHWKGTSTFATFYRPEIGAVDASYNTIKAQLDAKRPWVWAGGVHAFVLDGYRDDYWYHFNWGWQGYYDGWYHRSNIGYNNGYEDCDYSAGQIGVTYVPSANPYDAWPSTTVSGSVSNGEDVSLNWISQTGATGYKIYRTKDNAVTPTYLSTTTGLTFNDNDLPEGEFAYHIIVIYTTGESRNSNSYTALIDPLPQYPNATNFKAVTSGRTSIDLSWYAPYDGILNFYESFESGLGLPAGWIYIASRVDGGWLASQETYGSVINIADVSHWGADYTKMVAHGVNNFFLNSSAMPDGDPAPVVPEVLMWGWLLSPKATMEASNTVKYWGRFRILNSDGTLPAAPASGWPAYDVVSYLGSFSETVTDRITHRIHQSFIINSIATNNVWDRQEVVSLASAAGEYTRVGFKVKENVYSMCFDEIIIGKENPYDCEGYEVYRNGELATTINSRETITLSDTDFIDGENTYFIKAIYPTGTSISSEHVTATIDANPKPDNLTAVCNTTVQLSWYAPYHNPPKWYAYYLPENSTATADVLSDATPIPKRRTIFKAEDLGFYYPVTLDSVAIGFYDWDEGNWNGNNTFTIRISKGGVGAFDDVIYQSPTLTANHNQIKKHALPTPIVLNEPWNVEVVTNSTGYPGTLATPVSSVNNHSFFEYNDGTGASYYYSLTDGLKRYEWLHLCYVTSSAPPPIAKTGWTSSGVDIPEKLVTVANTRKLKSDVLDFKALNFYKIYRDGTVVGTSTTTSYEDNYNLFYEAQYYVTASYANPTGESEPSNETTVYGLLSAPPQNVITSLSGGNVKLNWDDLSSTISYNVYTSDSPDGAFTLLTTVSMSEYTYIPTVSKKFFYITGNSVLKKDAPRMIEIPKKVK